MLTSINGFATDDDIRPAQQLMILKLPCFFAIFDKPVVSLCCRQDTTDWPPGCFSNSRDYRMTADADSTELTSNTLRSLFDSVGAYV